MCYTVTVSFIFYFLYIFITDNISISMYIMCVILGLFSALSCRVGALQISIIIITDFNCNWRSDGVDMISDGWKSATRIALI